MKIWKMSSDANNFNNFRMPKQEERLKFLDYPFDGTSIKDNWLSFKVEVIEEIKQGDKQSLFGTIPVINEKSVKVLKKFLDDNAEILPLTYDRDKYYLINVMNVVKCLDLDKSEYKTFNNSSKIMRFIKYEFIYDAIKNDHIFILAEKPKGGVFVSDLFKETVEKNSLTGYMFEEVWDSEADTK